MSLIEEIVEKLCGEGNTLLFLFFFVALSSSFLDC